MVLAFGISWALWGVAATVPGTGVGAIAQIVRRFGRRSPQSLSSRARRADEACTKGCSSSCGSAVRSRRRSPRCWPRPCWVSALAADHALGATTSIVWPPWPLLPIIVAYVVVLGGPLGEELGWRGWLLPRLEARFGALPATLLGAASGRRGTCHCSSCPTRCRHACRSGCSRHRSPSPASATPGWSTACRTAWFQPSLRTSFNVTVGIALLTPPPGDLALRPFLGALAAAAVLTRTGTFRTPRDAAVQRSSPGEDRGRSD